MKAEEMFKNLGFTRYEDNMDNKDACISYWGNTPQNEYARVEFPLKYDVVFIHKDTISYELINAINKQCEELIELKNK